ncbi:MAG TPA: ABC transporter permease [Micromonosporaceae bacterium]
MIHAFRVLGRSLTLGIAEFRTIYTVRSWLLSWLVRMLAQTAFFASIGLVVNSPQAIRYLLIGNAVVLVCLEANIVVLFMAGERYQGTLTGLLATPTPPVVVLLGRGLNWVLTGAMTSLITLSVLPVLFGIPLSALSLLECVPIVLVTGIASYGYGSFLGGLTLRFPQLDWLVMNVGYLLVMAFAGVNVPISFWPDWLTALAQVLPVTHGLQAVRGVLDGAAAGVVLGQIGLELLVGAAWFALAAWSYRIFVQHVRARAAFVN